jgi:hypothetical protein
MVRIYDVEPVRKGCKFCGSKTVSWRESSEVESGWVLMEMFEDSTGRNYVEDGQTHFHYCERKKTNRRDHAAVQATHLNAERMEHEQMSEGERERDEKVAQQNADWFMTLLRMDEDEQRDKLAELVRKLKQELRDPVSMDYFTEHCRYVANVKRIKCDIDILRAMLKMPPLYSDET